METSLRETVLAEQHRGLGARMGAFAGWSMPIRYPAGIVAEHEHTRSAVSLFDTCHMGEFRLRGEQAAPELDLLLPRRATDQRVGTCRYNFLLGTDGGVLDDLLVYRLAADEFYLVVNAGQKDAAAEWVQQHLTGGTTFRDESLQTGKLDLQGPMTVEVLAGLGVDQALLPRYYRCRRLELCGVEALVSRTGYTGEAGVEIYVPAEHVGELWQALLSHSAVHPAGLGARDTLRLEMGFPLYGAELSAGVTPIEAGFGHFVDMTGRQYIGWQSLSREHERRLVGFRLAGRRAARAGHRVWDARGAEIGTVTSGSYAPSLGFAVALGYVRGEGNAKHGIAVSIGLEPDAVLEAAVVLLPFYTGGTAKVEW